MEDMRPRCRHTRILESGRGTSPGAGEGALPAAMGVRETPWKHGVRGNRDFAKGLTSDLPVKPPRIVLLQRSHLSRSLSLFIPPFYLSLNSSLSATHLLLLDRLRPRDTNLSSEAYRSLSALSLSLSCRHHPYFIMLYISRPSRYLIFSLSQVTFIYGSWPSY